MNLYLIHRQYSTPIRDADGNTIYYDIRKSTCYDIGVDKADVLLKHPAWSVHPRDTVEVWAVRIGPETLEDEIARCYEIIDKWKDYNPNFGSLGADIVKEQRKIIVGYKKLLKSIKE